ncbi:major facilitator superfamily domain-containing protein [Annulohypoxylon truncatum]|uniref:major facilitator superfamily domain-containing protein n=1 Tax=Annulohypoxylon truncatum TaxID=327061 RepID=UPI0020083EEA|nr:major facilitator superfamily domain-containing protein [Annulohypoxylon truncatum]KAI1207929.1 major facilitator superfamily domain-containing protein [Annulohypoxylon truncatum]
MAVEPTPDGSRIEPYMSDTQDREDSPSGHPPQFWLIIVALSFLAFISAVDVTIIPPALPTITQEIGGSKQYVWIANSFVFASTVPQPLVGQLSNIFGRKYPVVVSIVLFIVGSGIAGGAKNAATLIAGRAIQGVGAGGIYVLIDIVCCDLVPLRDRGKYLGIVNAWAGVAAGLGPVIGGLLAQANNWRWIFFLNIPICALPLITILLFMKVKTGDGISHSIKKLDYLGNIIFIPSIISLLFGLVTGGIDYPWSSWRIILPLVLGIAGWITFHFQQHFFTYGNNASVPSRLFSNRTSVAGYAMTFLSAVCLQTSGFFLPIYFQAVVGTTVADSGIYFLPTTIGLLFFAAIGGVLLSKFGAYRPIHAASFALSVIGYGLFTILGQRTPKVAWAFFQLISAAGLGSTLTTILPAILVALPESDVASATAVFSFIKTFGFTWGVTIASIIFNAVFNNNLYSISSPALRDQLADGGAYSFASQASNVIDTADDTAWGEARGVYIMSLKAVWWFGLGISAAGLLLVGMERHFELSTELKTEYGLSNDGQARPSEPNEVKGNGTVHCDPLPAPSL